MFGKISDSGSEKGDEAEKLKLRDYYRVRDIEEDEDVWQYYLNL